MQTRRVRGSSSPSRDGSEYGRATPKRTPVPVSLNLSNVDEHYLESTSPSKISPRKKFVMGWTNAQQGQLHPPLRRDHSCVQYGNFAIIYGGYQAKPLGDMWVLDCVSMRWSQFPQAARDRHPGKRCGHSTLLINEKIWLFGGETEKNICLNDVWIFDLATKEWQKVVPIDTDLPAPRFGHAAVAVGTSMFIFGGADRNSECYDDLWCFETTTFSWSRIQTDPCPSKRHGHTITVVSPNKILLFGGYGPETGRLNDLWEFDPYLLQWTCIEVAGKQPSRRAYHAAVPFRSRLFIFGGQGPTAMGDLWQYAPGAKQWKQIQVGKPEAKGGSVPQNVLWPAARYGHIATTYGGDTILTFGGIGDGSAYRDDLWTFFIDLALPQESDLEVNSIGPAEGIMNDLSPGRVSDLWSQMSQCSEDTRKYLNLEKVPLQHDRGTDITNELLSTQLRMAVQNAIISSPAPDSALVKKLSKRVTDLERQLEAQRKDFERFKEMERQMIQETIARALANQRLEFDEKLEALEERLLNAGTSSKNKEKETEKEQQDERLREQVDELQREMEAIKRVLSDRDEEEVRHMAAFRDKIQETLETTDALSSLFTQYLTN